MNRPGANDKKVSSSNSETKAEGTVTEFTAEEVVSKLVVAKTVIVVPGYGMVRNHV
jgi:NAD/NADP transhydrogenase beta subunit